MLNVSKKLEVENNSSKTGKGCALVFSIIVTISTFIVSFVLSPDTAITLGKILLGA